MHDHGTRRYDNCVNSSHTASSGASSRLMCPICETTKPLMKNWDPLKEWPYRTDYTIGHKNISRSPLMANIKSTDIVVPVTHVLTGLTKKAMVILEKKLLGEAIDVKWVVKSVPVIIFFSGRLMTLRNCKRLREWWNTQQKDWNPYKNSNTE